MSKYVVSFLEPKLDLEGRLNSESEVCCWRINGNRLENPFFSRVSVPFILPTKPLSQKDRTEIEDYLNQYREFNVTEYQKKANKLKKELEGKKKKNTKGYKTKKAQLDIINEFLDSSKERIRWEMKKTKDYEKIVHLHTPFLSKLSREIYLSSYLPVSDGRLSINKNLASKMRFPFSIVEDDNNKNLNFAGEKASLESIVQQPGLAIDFETHNWGKVDIPEDYKDKKTSELEQTLIEFGKSSEVVKNKRRDQLLRDLENIHNQLKNERITVANISNLDKGFNYLITTLDFPEKYIEVDNPLSNKKERFEVIKSENQHELIERVNKLFEEFQPFFVYGHNQMKFDYNKAMELTNNFKSGVERRKPKLMAQIPNGYIQQVILPGRIDIDPCIYSQLYMSNADNRLDTVFKTVTGKETEKTLSHGEMIEKTRLAEQGNERAAKEILFYAAQDAMKSYIIGEKLKKEHILLANVFNSLPARVDTCSPRKMSCDYHEHDYLKRKGYYRYFPFERDTITLNEKAERLLEKEGRLSFQDFELEKIVEKSLLEARKKGYVHTKCLPYINQEDNKENKLFYLEDIVLSEPENENIVEHETKRLKTKKGVYECKLVVINPFIETFKEFIEHDENLVALYEEAKQSPPLKRLRYSRAITNLLEFPVFKSLDRNTNNFKKDFKGIFSSSLDEIKNSLYNNIKHVSELFMNDKVINFSKDLYLIKNDKVSSYLLERLEDKGLAFEIGDARALSGNKGVMIGTTWDYDFMEGFSPPDSNKGEKFPFQAEFYADFLDEIIYNKNERKALEIFKDYLKAFVEDEFSESSFVIRKELKRHFYEYSSAYNAPQKKHIIDQRAKKGDSIEYSYSKEELYEKLFGYSSTKFSPIKGKLTRLLCWVFNIDNSLTGKNKKEILRDAIENKNYKGLFSLIEE
jgi:predicted RNA-binding protein Jag